MSQTKSPAQPTLVFPAVFLIAVTVILTLILTPQHVDPSLLPQTATPTPIVVAVQPTPTMDTTNMDHQTLMALGLEEVNASSVRTGERIFTSTCSACHGYDAKGISGLGKPLIGSDFANSLTDADLVSFISVGRAPSDPLNTTGQQMPARGGNPGLSDDDLNAVVDYIRSLNGATVLNDVEQQTASTSTGFTPIDVNGIAGVPSSSGGSGEADLSALPPVEFTAPDYNALDASAVPASSGANGELDFGTMSGQQAYIWSCAGCHGIDGQGIPVLGTLGLSNLPTDDAAIIEMLTVHGDVTAAVHPGGYPALTDEQLQSVLDYVRGMVK